MEQVERVDHAAEARLAVAQAGQYFGDEADPTCVAAAAIGQVHASLAIAEQLERLNDQLDGPGANVGAFLEFISEDLKAIARYRVGDDR